MRPARCPSFANTHRTRRPDIGNFALLVTNWGTKRALVCRAEAGAHVRGVRIGGLLMRDIVIHCSNIEELL